MFTFSMSCYEGRMNGQFCILRSSLLDHFGLVNGELIINCEVELIEPEQYANKSASSAFQDYGQLLTSGKFSDVTMVVGGERFAAHKSILAARSPVFAAMFDHDTKERQENKVDIPDMDAKVFQELLNFIYTCKANDSMLPELLVAADKV